MRGEVVCRREAFGGIVFHPDDATFVELDHDGFETVRRCLIAGETPTVAEQAFLRELEETAPLAGRTLRLVEQTTPATRSLPGVLSAPTLVDFQITDKCGLGCPQCYASSIPGGKEARWEDAVLAVEQMREAGVCQVALGGGEPATYSRLEDLLQLIRDHGLVPNLTTTAIGIGPARRQAIARHCGAVAMSLEAVGERFAKRRKQGFEVFNRSLAQLLDSAVPVVLQITVSADNLADLDSLVDYCLSINPLYGVIFLAYKPVGRGEGYDRPLFDLKHSDVHQALAKALARLHPHTRVGFDCCFTPGIAGIEGQLGYDRGSILEGCSATRASIGLTPRLDVLPCTFVMHKPLGNLRNQRLVDLWHDVATQRFRSAMEAHATKQEACRTCSVNSACLGGCSVWSLVGCDRM